MKALSIQQPWGALITCGLKNVENRKWALKTLPARVLIHAGARRQPLTDNNMPYPYYWLIENYQNMGWLPALEKTPTSAIIGIATITACEAGNQSLWASRGPGAEFQWVMKDVKMFKEPIRNVKGMLGLFEVPGVNENNLPECLDVQLPHRNGDTIYLPLSNKLFNEIESGERSSLDWNIVDANLGVFAKLAGNTLVALPTRNLVITNNGRTMPLSVANYRIYPIYDENGEMYCEEDEFGNLYEWWKAGIEFE